MDMKTIYVDDMFLLNLVINYFILLATGKICALPLKRGRFALAAAVGAAYSVLTLFPAAYFLVSLPMKLCLGIIMVLISFGSAKRIYRPFIAFLCISAAFGGAVFAASMLAGTPVEDGLYINASMRTLALSFAACYAALTLVFKRLGRRTARRVMDVRICLGGREVALKALHDTGNELFDPLSGLPVMVVEAEALAAMFPLDALAALQRGAGDFISSIGENGALKTRFRLVPYKSPGVGRGLIPVFRPDKLLINGEEKSDVLIGLCGNSICPDDEFSAIF